LAEVFSWILQYFYCLVETGWPPASKTWKSEGIWHSGHSGKVQGNWKRSGEMCFACGMLPQLRWSHN